MAGSRGAMLLLAGLFVLAAGSVQDARGSGADMEARVHELEGQLQKFMTQRQAADARSSNSVLSLLGLGFLVMFMQGGFAMFKVGSCRAKSAQHVLGRSLLDLCVGAIAWYAFGYCLAYGTKDDHDRKNTIFAGNGNYFGKDLISYENGDSIITELAERWFYEWAFCSIAATIVSGAVAERMRFPAYIVFTFLMSMIIYPCVAHWVWAEGFLAREDSDGKLGINQVGAYDAAGSGIVHMTGGIAALVACILVGPRKGRFVPGNEEYDPHNVPLIVLGTFILWFGWYGANCGKSLIPGASSMIAAQAAMNTTLSAAMSGLTVALLRFLLTGKVDVPGICNGIVAGLVSIAAGCANMEAGYAILVGFLGALLYQGSSSLLKILEVDDPIDAFPTHGICGLWGLLAAAFFDWGEDGQWHGNKLKCVPAIPPMGGCIGNGQESAVGANFALAGMIIAWAGALTLVILLPFKLVGALRVDEDSEIAGIDEAEHVPRFAYRIPAPPASESDVESRRRVTVSRVIGKQ